MNLNLDYGLEKKIDGKITLKNIFFEYPKEEGDEIVRIIKNINLEILPGMKIGIVGFSGSGKSTVINLIERLYDVGFYERKKSLKIIQEKLGKKDKDKDKDKNEFDDASSNNSQDDSDEEKKLLKNKKEKKKENKHKNKQNEKEKLIEEKIKYKNTENENNIIKSEDDCAVFIDDINIKKYNIKSLHSQIGYVPQEPSLFDGTIRENVIYGLFDDENMILNNKDPYEKELKWSLHTAQADFVYDENTFPLGLNTIVGSKGAKLSGGQKQRIAIARALIKKPKILILDEATSALDSESESKFQLELDNLKGKMTIIVVSHRLCTIKDCDQIVVINKGQIVEKGNHDELIAIKGIYYSLMEKQLEKE